MGTSLNPTAWQHRLQKGETFESWEELQDHIVDHGVSTERVIQTYKKDKSRLIVKCRMSGDRFGSCAWHVRAIQKYSTDLITITQCFLEHSCEAADHYDKGMYSKSGTLAKRIMDIIVKNRQTRACSLRDTAQALVHPDTRYHTAHRAKQRCLVKIDGSDKESFHLIPDHCRHIVERDPAATVSWSAPNRHFETLFVCPGAAKEAYKHCRPLVAFDGTHTRSAYPQILLIATCLDANNTVLMLAYCMVPTENLTEWVKFMKLIRQAIPNLSKPNTVFVSDREKGLLAGVDDVFPFAYHSFCSWHLKDNLHTHFGKAAQKDFEGLVYAPTPEKYADRLERIKLKNVEWWEYIRKTASPIHYSRAFFPVKRWGHETSQYAESLNRALKPQRMEVAFKQSNLLWDYIMKHHFDKSELANTVQTPFPPNIMAILKKTEEDAYQLIADESSHSEVRITDGDQRQFLVLFSPQCQCSCGDWQDVGLPCAHAWRAMTTLKKRHHSFVDPFYSTENFCRTYAVPIPAILRDNLIMNVECGEPLFKRKRGRPSEKAREHFQDEDPIRRPRRCGFCKQSGRGRGHCSQYQEILARGRETVAADDRSPDSGHDVHLEDEENAESEEDDESHGSRHGGEDSRECSGDGGQEEYNVDLSMSGFMRQSQCSSEGPSQSESRNMAANRIRSLARCRGAGGTARQ